MKTPRGTINATFWMHLSHVLRHVHEAVYSTDREPSEILHHEMRPGSAKLTGIGDEVRLLHELRGRLRALDNTAALEHRVLHVAEAAPYVPVVKLPSVLRQEIAEAAAHTRWHLEILSTGVDGVQAALEAVGGTRALMSSSRRDALPFPLAVRREEQSEEGVGPILEAGATILEQTMEVLSQASWETQNEASGRARRSELMQGVSRVWASFAAWSGQCRGGFPLDGEKHFTAQTHERIGEQSIQYLDQGVKALRMSPSEASPPCARLLWEAAFEAIHRAYELRVVAAGQGVPVPPAMGVAPGTCRRNPAMCGLSPQ